MTAVLAARMNGRADSPPLFTSIRVGNDTVMLEAHDCQTLRLQFVTSIRSITECPDHDRTIKCAGLASWREWYYFLQRQAPTSSVALAAQNLWALVERFSQEYQRPKEMSPETLAILEAIGTRSEPDWFGKRSESGKQHQ
jgi:hypothetical protein